ncbi:hypothetical protein SARC_13929 [Sphaeroforma arctica JP610]|uniref:Uncharacterized protein n=1 Tax=Sphaeroforma arctica JP610 TaxID=667725 RepID=A0A0L0FBQ3_9EUKA|nr:hypothetical protein SARC_13929 [Sphaeroforma arctica JP610]KNC73513.1 hypothetical protein SARC_13929 [Sphaeroforma arctica JP610]|eukprot:XP_014147415.1 hypothetical protein SARC_13929 [Sphaeroforma arctica JP610]
MASWYRRKRWQTTQSQHDSSDRDTAHSMHNIAHDFEHSSPRVQDSPSKRIGNNQHKHTHENNTVHSMINRTQGGTIVQNNSHAQNGNNQYECKQEERPCDDNVDQRTYIARHTTSAMECIHCRIMLCEAALIRQRIRRGLPSTCTGGTNEPVTRKRSAVEGSDAHGIKRRSCSSSYERSGEVSNDEASEKVTLDSGDKNVHGYVHIHSEQVNVRNSRHVRDNKHLVGSSQTCIHGHVSARALLDVSHCFRVDGVHIDTRTDTGVDEQADFFHLTTRLRVRYARAQAYYNQLDLRNNELRERLDKQSESTKDTDNAQHDCLPGSCDTSGLSKGSDAGKGRYDSTTTHTTAVGTNKVKDDRCTEKEVLDEDTNASVKDTESERVGQETRERTYYMQALHTKAEPNEVKEGHTQGNKDGVASNTSSHTISIDATGERRESNTEECGAINQPNTLGTEEEEMRQRHTKEIDALQMEFHIAMRGLYTLVTKHMTRPQCECVDIATEADTGTSPSEVINTSTNTGTSTHAQCKVWPQTSQKVSNGKDEEKEPAVQRSIGCVHPRRIETPETANALLRLIEVCTCLV